MCVWGAQERFLFTRNGCKFLTHLESKTSQSEFVFKSLARFKDVRAHCYCASLVRTLYMTWCVPRHVFQARASSRNSTKYRAYDLCGNLICEYFCWMLGDPHFFFRQITSFSDSFHYTKKQRYLYVGSFNYFSYTVQIGSNWYIDTGVRVPSLQKFTLRWK